MELEDGSVFPFEKLIYEGDDGPAAVAAAESHHAARTRRLAWERYMAENDPPEDGKRCE
ncbi:hypothetical protein [Mycobacteroides abscessus]|uniref:hypothetical protein n=1 Tax=Mycobacteroides abscessus TaxID=36809 RepID=UPI001643EC23|nr:hypothetical protein [Mycobacteroides abscessus]